MSSHIKQASK